MQSYSKAQDEADAEKIRQYQEHMAEIYRKMSNAELIEALKTPGIRLVYAVHLVIAERIRDFEALKTAAESYTVQTHWVCECGKVNATSRDQCAKCQKLAAGRPASFWEMVESLK